MNRLISLFALILTFCGGAFAQAQPTCSANAPTIAAVHAEGLTERLGDLVITCSGGTAGATASLNLFLSVNTSLTNRVDANGMVQGIAISGATAGGIRLAGGSTINIAPLNYTIPAAPAMVTITISGVRAAVAPLVTGIAPASLNYSALAIGANLPSTTIPAGISTPTLLSSFLNNGVPCNGSLLPSALDFSGFSTTTVSSTARLTEASFAAFTKKETDSDAGLRFLLKFTGYGAGTRIFLPDAIVGTGGTIPTSAGAFGVSSNAGSYTPGLSQLLLARVNGTDSTGAGGALALGPPTSATTFSSVSEVTVANGSGFAVYEVLDSNPALQESAQIPFFVAVNPGTCPSALAPALTVQLAPVSSVTNATETDPIPRFVAGNPASDCMVIGDCSAPYFPALVVDTTPVILMGSSKGGTQSANIRIGNSGSGIVTFSTSVTYPSGAPAGWLSVTPVTGSNNVTLTVSADATSLDPGTYSATVNVNGGAFGSASIPVTFVVGPVGVVIQNVGNAASFQYGTVTPGSYAVIFGLNMSGTSVAATFNGLAATILYKSAGQINVVVPAGLGSQLGAAVIVTVDGKISNSFRVNLAPNNLGIFNPGIVNVEDGTVNSSASPATRGKFISVYLTGLTIPVTGQVTVNIGDQLNLIPTFAGAQPTLPALDQVNVMVPSSLSLTTNPVKVAVCIPNTLGQQICSNQVDLYLK